MTVWHPRVSAPRRTLPRRDHRLLVVVGSAAALLLVAGLVLRGTVALRTPPGQRIVAIDPATGAIESGDVTLAPDATRPLFPDVHLDPGEPVAACVEIAHAGDVPVRTVALRLDAAARSSLLLDRLHLRVDRGGPARTPDCTGFVPEVTVADGRLVDLLTAPDAPGWDSWQPVGDERATYRFTVVLPAAAADDALQGSRARVDFLWAATAAADDGLRGRLSVLALAVLRDAVPPLLLLAVVAVLFLGVQDRIDRRDPKLALAAVVETPDVFRPVTAAPPIRPVPEGRLP